MPKKIGIQRYSASERLKEAEEYEASLTKAQESGKDYSAQEHTTSQYRGDMRTEKEFSDGSVRVWDDYEQRWVIKKK